MDWNKRAEEIKELYSLNDAGLADYLGVTRGAIYLFKSGRQEWPLATKLKILDKIAYKWSTSTLASIFPDAVSKKMIQATKLQTKKIAVKNSPTDQEVKKFIEDETYSWLVRFYRLRAVGVSFEDLQKKLEEANEKIKIE